MPRKYNDRKDLIAQRVANIADVAGTATLDRDTYFEVIEKGIAGWLEEEKTVRSTPQGSADGLSDPQRRVFAVALGRIARAAQAHRNVRVVAHTTSVQRVMKQQLLDKPEPRYIFLGWKQRLEKRASQPVVTEGGEYLMLLSISGTSGRREIRADVAASRGEGEGWKLTLVFHPLPPVEEEMESIAAPEPSPAPDTVVAAVVRSTYLVLRVHDAERAQRFVEWCNQEAIPIAMWLRRELKRKHVRIVESVQVEVTRGIVTGGTDGALALQTGGGAIEKKMSHDDEVAAGLNQSAEITALFAQGSQQSLERAPVGAAGLNQDTDIGSRIAMTGLPDLPTKGDDKD
jgi:hypothetical protein